MTENEYDEMLKENARKIKEPCITETEMDEYIKNENPKLILSSVDEDEYKDVLKEPCDDKDWRFYFNHGYAQAKRDLQRSCDDAISREAVLKVIDGWYEQNRDTENIEDLIILITYMGSVQPSRKGHWIEYDNECECPFCHKTWNYCDNDTQDFDHCPKCGADMREGDNE